MWTALIIAWLTGPPSQLPHAASQPERLAHRDPPDDTWTGMRHRSA